MKGCERQHEAIRGIRRDRETEREGRPRRRGGILRMGRTTIVADYRRSDRDGLNVEH